MGGKSDFARSLRFNVAVGSLTYGALCWLDGAAALEFERLNDRPFGVMSLLNALAMVKASFAVFVNVRVLQLNLLPPNSQERNFVVGSLGLGVVRLVTTVLVATY